MLLAKGKGTMNKNIKELMDTKPSKRRMKGIKTIAKRTGLSPRAAELKQAVAIAYKQNRKKK